MKLRSIAVMALLVGLVATGCSSDDDDAVSSPPASTAEASAEPSASATPAGYPVTVTSSIGDTEIAAKPTRIAVFDGADTDIALQFGIEPVAHITGDFTYSPWLDGKLDTADNVLGEQDLNLEQLAAAKPDLIVAGTWATEDVVNRLKAIAPTVGSSLTDGGADQNATPQWRERVTLFGEILDERAQAADIISDTEDYLAEQAAKIPDIADKTFRFLAFITESAEFLNGNASVFTDLGFTATDDNKERESLSFEFLSQLDSDYLFIWTTDEGRKKLEGDSRFDDLPAVESGQLVWLTDAEAGASNNPSPYADRYFIDSIISQLAD